jgi:quercetin dioxygenase-like cupin family protein
MDTNSRWTGGLARYWRRWALVPLAVIALSLLGLGVLATAVVPVSAQPEPGGFDVEVLAPHSAFPDDIQAQFRIKLDGKGGTEVINVRNPDHAVVVKVTIEPEGSLGWHTHPGPAIAVVAQGALSIINASDCVERVYEAGQAFVDPGRGNVHIGFNASETDETVVYVTYLDVPEGESPGVPANDPGC